MVRESYRALMYLDEILKYAAVHQQLEILSIYIEKNPRALAQATGSRFVEQYHSRYSELPKSAARLKIQE